MKYLMKVGDQLDLQVSYDGGAVDGVTYNAPDGYDNKVSVTAAGIVTALGLGEGVVNVLSGGAIVGTIVFDVLTEAAYVAQQGIRDGSKALVVDADAVAPAPTFVKITSLTPQGAPAFGSGQYNPEKVFDGDTATWYISNAVFGSVTTAHLGASFATPKMVKKILVKWVTAPTEIDVLSGSGEFVGGIIATFTVAPYTDPNTPSISEVILPAYTPATAIFIRPKTATPVANSYWAQQGAATIDRLVVSEIELYE